MELRKLYKNYILQVKMLYPHEGAESLVLWLFEHYLGVKRMDVLLEKRIDIPLDLEEAFDKLTKGTPIQYILQSAPFYGREFKVGPSVLIPRRETEELVHLIIQENSCPGLTILDVGTGSGCIPVTLSLEMEEPKIAAVDISESALALAKANAEKFFSAIQFFQMDVLTEDFPIKHLDILVSNPPYVRESEKSAMHMNVLDHEPHLALFVPDDNALIFYQEIAKKGLSALKVGGKLYLEINETLGAEVMDLLSSLGYQQIRLIKDLNDKDRIVTAAKTTTSQ